MKTIFICIYYVLIYRLAQFRKHLEATVQADAPRPQPIVRAVEREDDDYHDSDWDWPVVPPQENTAPSTALMCVFNPQRDWEEYADSIEYQQFVNNAEEDRL